MSEMKLGIVAEFYDRASRGMAKLLRNNDRLEKSAKAQKKMAGQNASAITKSARAQGKLTRALG